MNWSLENKIRASFGLAVVFLAVTGAVAWWNAARGAAAFQTVEHTRAVLAQVEAVMLGMLNLEIGMSRFVATGEEKFLESGYRTRDEVSKSLAELRRLTADNPGQQKRLAQLEPLTAQDRLNMAQIIRSRRTNEVAAKEMVTTGSGKVLMEAIQSLVAEMEREETQLLQQRASAVQSSARASIHVVEVGGLAALFITGAAGLLVLRGTRQQAKVERVVRKLEEEARTTLQSIGDGVLATDAEGRITRLNAVAEQLTGWTQAEAAGKPVAEVFHIINEGTRQLAFLPVADTLEKGVVHDLANHTVLVARDGAERPIADSCAPIRTGAGRVSGAVLVFRDVTAQRRAEQEIAKFAAETQDLYNHAPCGYHSVDSEGVFVAVNDTELAWFGRTREELIGKVRHRDLVTPDTQAAYDEGFAHFLKHGEVRDLEFKIARPDGTVMSMLLNASAVRDADGRLLRSRSTMFDITDRKQAEEALGKSEEKLRVTLESIGDGVLATDAAGRVTRLNAVAEQLTGWTHAEAAGRPVGEIFHIINEKTRQPALIPVADTLAKGVVRGLANHTVLVARDGAERPIADSCAPIRSQTGEVIGAVLVFRDQTAERAAAARLRQHAEEIEDLYNHAPCGYHSLNNDGVFVKTNDTELSWLGYTRDEVVGRMKFADLLTPESQTVFRDVFARFKELGFAKDVEYDLLRKDGSTLPVLLNATAVRDASGKIIASRATMFDLTDRKAVEQMHLHFRALFESLPGLYLVLKPDLTIVAASDAYLKATMTEREKILGRGLFEVFPDNPADLDANGVSNLRASLDRVIANLAPDTMAIQKYDVRRPDEVFERRYWSPINSPVLGPGRRLEYIVHRVEDVTDFMRQRQPPAGDNATMRARLEQMEAEIFQSSQSLQAANERLLATNAEMSRLSAILAATPDYVAISRLDGQRVYLNPAGRRMIGLDENEDVTQTRIADFYTPGSAKVIMEEGIPWAVQHGVWSGETNLRTRDGRDIPVSQILLAHKNSRGEVDYVSTVARDITERKRAEAAQARLTAILNATPDFVGMATPEGRVVYLNESLRLFAGIAPDEDVSKLSVPDFHPPEVTRLILEDAIPLAIRDGVWFGETRLRARDGRELPISQLILAHKNAAGEVQHLSTIARDITMQKGAETALLHSKQAAEEASQAKSQFLANMSHELRTPLNAILGFSEILEDQTFGPLNARQARYVSNVLTSGRHLLQLINDILDLSKVEAGRMDLRLEMFSPFKATSDVLAVVKAIANKKSITLVNEIPEQLPLLNADQPKFKQVLYNLLSNAVKFTHEGGRITLTAGVSGGNGTGNPALLSLSVADTGIGIKPEDQGRIWKEFEQVDSTYARKQHGTGLGLSLCKRLIELHGGHIRVESEGVEGRGSTFVVELPLLAPERPELPELFTPENAGKLLLARRTGGQRPLVLVIEDDLQAAGMLDHHLLTAGYDVAHAIDGTQALTMAEKLRPFAITLDILLPGKTGWEVLAELKSNAATRDIPVVIVSITDDRQLGFSLGAVEFLVKPIAREQLLAAIQKAGHFAEREIRTVMIVDDDPKIVETLAASTRALGFHVIETHGGRQALNLVVECLPDLVILDLLMPDVNGFEVVERLRANALTARLPVLIHTAKDLTDEERAQLLRQVQGITPKSAGDELVAELARLAQRRDEHSRAHGEGI